MQTHFRYSPPKKECLRDLKILCTNHSNPMFRFRTPPRSETRTGLLIGTIITCYKGQGKTIAAGFLCKFSEWADLRYTIMSMTNVLSSSQGWYIWRLLFQMCCLLSACRCVVSSRTCGVVLSLQNCRK